MLAKVLIPTPLKPYTGYQEEVMVEGVTVGEALENLTDRYPGYRPWSKRKSLHNFLSKGHPIGSSGSGL